MATEASGGAVKKRQKKGKIVQEVTKVSEATRINVSKILEEFRKSDDEGNLNPNEKKNSCIDLLRERERNNVLSCKSFVFYLLLSFDLVERYVEFD